MINYYFTFFGDVLNIYQFFKYIRKVYLHNLGLSHYLSLKKPILLNIQLWRTAMLIILSITFYCPTVLLNTLIFHLHWVCLHYSETLIMYTSTSKLGSNRSAWGWKYLPLCNKLSRLFHLIFNKCIHIYMHLYKYKHV